ncbi:SAM-dependent methyltransferase [Paraburkholderia bannensis]|uniref:SAM-dependent methyltransferase n=1 Tax=Paraburkholderia bannensis TaxID=765414 RepID=A0A7W9TXV0_9BURK|nr:MULTISPECIES: class I SAM-dependent methyltransferase [Paraburkholderia]MBB3258404.1 SAM-dependent methyltransferase [Paraburkholderia sp. WP4_3_2]MBB6103417.1 SAM-dependent methyltransferase [Paraburkholderia bannensis]
MLSNNEKSHGARMTSQTEIYLKDFHRRRAGATRRAYGNLPARSAQAEYPSSYHALANRVPNEAISRTVLDLACGDGPLLKILNDRGHAATRLIGIDMSDGELSAARRILPREIRLLNERAQELSFESGSVDYVLSHMALMLMDDIEQVVREIRRVLREGGSFAAIVGRTFLTGKVGEVFLDIFKPIAKTQLEQLRLGDTRTRSEVGWQELLKPDFVDVAFEDIEINWTPTPEQLWLDMLDTYDADRLSETARAQFKSELLAAFAPMQGEDGKLQTGWGLRLVQATAA